MTNDRFANYLGITKQKVSNYKNGVVKPNFEVLQKLSEKGVNINWLLTGEGEPYKTDCGGGTKENIVALKEEIERLKKMVGMEAVKYINSTLLSGQKGRKK